MTWARSIIYQKKQVCADAHEWVWAIVTSWLLLLYVTDEKEDSILGSILLPSFHISMLSVDDHISRKYAFKVNTGFSSVFRSLNQRWWQCWSLFNSKCVLIFCSQITTQDKRGFYLDWQTKAAGPIFTSTSYLQAANGNTLLMHRPLNELIRGIYTTEGGGGGGFEREIFRLI